MVPRRRPQIPARGVEGAEGQPRLVPPQAVQLASARRPVGGNVPQAVCCCIF